MKQILFKIIDRKDGWTGLTGFKTREQAEKMLPEMKEGREWVIESYFAREFEVN
jgi:hypothetical protein